MKRYEITSDGDNHESTGGEWARADEAEAEIAGAVLSRKLAEQHAENLERRIGELIAEPPEVWPIAAYVNQHGGVWLYRNDSGSMVIRVRGELLSAEFSLDDMYQAAAEEFSVAFHEIGRTQ